jgi:hypothetical protein
MFALKTLQRQKTGVVVTTATLQRQSCRITKLSSAAPSIIHHQGGVLRCFTAAAVSNSSAVIGAPPPTTAPTTATSTKHYGVLSSSLLSVIMNSSSSSTINNPSFLSNALLPRTATVTSTVSSIFSELWENGVYLISTLKRRKKAMNKHKLRKRRKKNRMKNKK